MYARVAQNQLPWAAYFRAFSIIRPEQPRDRFNLPPTGSATIIRRDDDGAPASLPLSTPA